MTERQKYPFGEGYSAYEFNAVRKNPYPDGKDHDEWERGWNQHHEDLRNTPKDMQEAEFFDWNPNNFRRGLM